jgi:hypothetical protein
VATPLVNDRPVTMLPRFREIVALDETR